MWPFKTRRERQLEAELDAANADRERIRGERDQFKQDRDIARRNREQILRQLAGADATNRRVHDRNLELNRRVSQLTESDPEYAAELERKVAEVLEEHDVHRKALADALGEQKRHLNWDALVGEVGGLAGSAAEWMGDHAREKARADELQQRLDDAVREPADGEWRGRARRAEKRADHLQKELDNALGLPAGAPLSSAPWQPGYQAPIPDTKASMP